jgi:hypothetical protein
MHQAKIKKFCRGEKILKIKIKNREREGEKKKTLEEIINREEKDINLEVR